MAQFEREIDFLLTKYKPISLSEISTYESKAPAFHLTFDDGLSQCYHTVAPILLRKGVPATFFLNNNFIDNKGLFYRFKTALILHKLHEKREHLKFISNYFSIKNDFDTIKAYLLELDHRQNAHLNTIGKQIGLSYEQFLQTEQPYMSTPQINELIDKGFTMGAHSQFHPRYELLSLDNQVKETITSIERLKNDFKLDYTTFAFPFSDLNISEEFEIKLRQTFPDVQLFGIKEIRPHKKAYYNRYIMELHSQASPQLALKYLYLKSIIKK